MITKRISVDTLTEQYRVTRAVAPASDAANSSLRNDSPEGEAAETVAVSRRFEVAETELTRLRHSMDRADVTAVIVKAELHVPGVADRSLVDSLWAGQTPSAAARFSPR